VVGVSGSTIHFNWSKICFPFASPCLSISAVRSARLSSSVLKSEKRFAIVPTNTIATSYAVHGPGSKPKSRNCFGIHVSGSAFTLASQAFMPAA
jgi:hypothetical protein